MINPSKETAYCFLCNDVGPTIANLTRHFQRRHSGKIPKEGRPPFANWIREAAYQSSNILSMFSVPGRPATATAKKRKNEKSSPLSTKRSKLQHQACSDSEFRDQLRILVIKRYLPFRQLPKLLRNMRSSWLLRSFKQY